MCLEGGNSHSSVDFSSLVGGRAGRAGPNRTAPVLTPFFFSLPCLCLCVLPMQDILCVVASGWQHRCPLLCLPVISVCVSLSTVAVNPADHLCSHTAAAFELSLSLKLSPLSGDSEMLRCSWFGLKTIHSDLCLCYGNSIARFRSYTLGTMGTHCCGTCVLLELNS